MRNSIATIVRSKSHVAAVQQTNASADSNIALCKYWGKRNTEINLPVTDSLSITLPGHGTTATLSLAESAHYLTINDTVIEAAHPAYPALDSYLDAYQYVTQHYYTLQLNFNIPVAAGLASSASCFAAIVNAFNQLYDWQLTDRERSVLARLGSGSASRSLGAGFYHWRKGTDDDGSDSFATAIPAQWPTLRIGLVIVSNKTKPISSRLAMQRTMQTSTLYDAWPQQVAHDLPLLHEAIREKNFDLLGKTAEHNANAMHACMQSAWPCIDYNTRETVAAKQLVYQLRKAGVAVYFTQDAGPNLKLLYEAHNQAHIAAAFPDIITIQPFGEAVNES